MGRIAFRRDCENERMTEEEVGSDTRRREVAEADKRNFAAAIEFDDMPTHRRSVPTHNRTKKKCTPVAVQRAGYSFAA